MAVLRFRAKTACSNVTKDEENDIFGKSYFKNKVDTKAKTCETLRTEATRRENQARVEGHIVCLSNILKDEMLALASLSLLR